VYGAYGTGAKPKILGSKALNITLDWTLDIANVWKTTATLGTEQNDIANLVFTNETAYGVKKNSLVGCVSQGQFFYNGTNDLLYLYSASNPATYYGVVEACGNYGQGQGIFTFTNCSYITVQNIDFRYSSAAAIEFETSTHCIIEDCNVAWVGGEYLNAGGANEIRVGNGISLWMANSYFEIRRNTVSQCYDAGISPQGGGVTPYTQSYISMYNNVITNCWYSYETWVEAIGTQINVNFYNNTCVNAGTVWCADQRIDKANGRHLMLWEETGSITNCNIKNNIFSVCTNEAIKMATYVKYSMDYNLYNVDSIATTWGGLSLTLADWQTLSIHDDNSLSANPLFVSSTNFNLQSTSPAINAGTNVGLPFNGSPDIGAYEFIDVAISTGKTCVDNGRVLIISNSEVRY